MLISILKKTQLVLFDRLNNFSAIDVKMNGSNLYEKSSFNIAEVFFLLNGIGGFTLALLQKPPSKKLKPRFVF